MFITDCFFHSTQSRDAETRSQKQKQLTAAEIVDTSKTGGNSKADFFFPDFGDKQEKRQYAQA